MHYLVLVGNEVCDKVPLFNLGSHFLFTHLIGRENDLKVSTIRILVTLSVGIACAGPSYGSNSADRKYGFGIPDNRIDEIRPNMTQQDVHNLLGPPSNASWGISKEQDLCETFAYSTSEGMRYSHVRYKELLAESAVTGRNYQCGLSDPDGEVEILN